jgi:hypothetical protein
MVDALCGDLIVISNSLRPVDDNSARRVLQAVDRIEELNAVIRKMCPEIATRRMLSFEAAEAIFSDPRRDQ